MDARLDATTRQKVDDLARHFHQPRAAVLRHIMQWGLSREQAGTLDQGDVTRPGAPSLPLRRFRPLRSGAAGGYRRGSEIPRLAAPDGAPDPPDGFPRQLAGGTIGERSHDSRIYGKRFMLRLDAASETTLQRLVEHFDVSHAEIIRQLLAQATPDTFPASWHLRVAERHGVDHEA